MHSSRSSTTSLNSRESRHHASTRIRRDNIHLKGHQIYYSVDPINPPHTLNVSACLRDPSRSQAISWIILRRPAATLSTCLGLLTNRCTCSRDPRMLAFHLMYTCSLAAAPPSCIADEPVSSEPYNNKRCSPSCSEYCPIKSSSVVMRIIQKHLVLIMPKSLWFAILILVTRGALRCLEDDRSSVSRGSQRLTH